MVLVDHVAEHLLAALHRCAERHDNRLVMDGWLLTLGLLRPVSQQSAPASPSLNAAAPLKPLPEPIDLEQYHVRKNAHVGGLINEYRLVA